MTTKRDIEQKTENEKQNANDKTTPLKLSENEIQQIKSAIAKCKQNIDFHKTRLYDDYSSKESELTTRVLDLMEKEIQASGGGFFSSIVHGSQRSIGIELERTKKIRASLRLMIEEEKASIEKFTFEMNGHIEKLRNAGVSV